jgi:hypothetical protein
MSAKNFLNLALSSRSMETNHGTVLVSPYPALVTVSRMGRAVSESMRTWTLYPQTYPSRWWS